VVGRQNGDAIDGAEQLLGIDLEEEREILRNDAARNRIFARNQAARHQCSAKAEDDLFGIGRNLNAVVAFEEGDNIGEGFGGNVHGETKRRINGDGFTGKPGGIGRCGG